MLLFQLIIFHQLRETSKLTMIKSPSLFWSYSKMLEAYLHNCVLLTQDFVKSA